MRSHDQPDVRRRADAAEPRLILVVVRQGGTEDADAVALAGQLGRLRGAGLVVMQVLDDAGAPSRRRAEERAARLHVANARALVAAVLPDGGDVEVVPVAGPSPGREIHATAMDLNAELIAVGSERDGPRGRVRLDSWTAGMVVRNAPCPVAVAPNGFRARKLAGPPAVGVAFDGAPESVAALRGAHALARAAGTPLRVIEVEPEDGEARSDEALEALGSEVPIRLTVPHGDPAARLTEASEQLDLLVCASRGRRPLRRLALGRVPLVLMRSAACPVLVVPPGRPAAARELARGARHA